MTPPLAGVRVVDLTRLLPGGFATLLLSSLGAQVIKVEEPAGGDGIRQMLAYPGQSESAGHLVLNRGKESVSLNLKDSAAQQAAASLVASCDVLIDSFRPGVLDRLGLSAARLAQINPRLVHVSITAFGSEGQYASLPAHDLNSVGYAGLLGFVGDDLPVMPGLQSADLSAGFHAALAVFAGLRVRDQTGDGYRADVSMAEAAATMTPLQLATLIGSGANPPIPDTLTGALACYQVYRCADGAAITVGGLEAKFFTRLCELIEAPELAGLQYDPNGQDELRNSLSQIFATRPASEWLDLLAMQDTCVGPVNGLDAALDSAAFADRDVVSHVQMAGGEGGRVFRATPWDHSCAPAECAPALGADTQAVLADVGVTAEQLDALVQAGVAKLA